MRVGRLPSGRLGSARVVNHGRREGAGVERREAADRHCWPWPPNWPLLAGEPSGEPGRPPKGTPDGAALAPTRRPLPRPSQALMLLPPRFLMHVGSTARWRSLFPLTAARTLGAPPRPAVSPPPRGV